MSTETLTTTFMSPALMSGVAGLITLQGGPALDAFRKFNASTELFGFMLHYDCRAGVGDSGPYPLPGGRFAIVRDHFLNETAYPWSGVAEGMPYCVTEVLVFPADKVTATVNEIMTTFTRPTNYLDAERAWPVPTGGRAAEVLTPVLLFGKGFPTVHAR